MFAADITLHINPVTALVVVAAIVIYLLIGLTAVRFFAINSGAAVFLLFLWPLFFTFALGIGSVFKATDYLRYRLNSGRCHCPPTTNVARPTYEKDGVRCCTRCGHIKPESA